jgi:choline dehydrogenase-like flavoprotein
VSSDGRASGGVAAADVVIVGAGTAGCVLAARLSESPSCQVVLLEAGPDLRWDTAPAELRGDSFHAARGVRERVWDGVGAVRAAGQTPRPYIRGYGVGGSSVVNAMVALPGEPDDYDEWERHWGCEGWGWSDVAPWFQRVAVTTSRAGASAIGAVNRALLEALPAYARLADLTWREGLGRTSVVDAYLEPARTRPNLQVAGACTVERIALEGRRAVGVELADGRLIAAQQVIVAAGAIHSPAVLLRSSVDLPGVGRNLHDHASFPIPLALHSPGDALALPISVVARATHRSTNDLQILPMDTVDIAAAHVGLVMPAVMRVHSRGSITLVDGDRAAGSDVALRIDFDMLSDERDVATMQAAIDLAERAIESRFFRAICDVMPYDRSSRGVAAALGDYVHAAGTCRMGAPADPLAVVDSACAVISYEGLYVCDASVMPTLPRANTHLPTLMIAERIADQIARRLAS